MTIDTVIEKFELYSDDMTELSSADELALANKVLRKVYINRPWEFLRTTSTGTTVTSSGVTSITLPSTFLFFADNARSSDRDDSTDYTRVVYVGTNRTPYRVVNMQDREAYRNQDGYVYYDYNLGTPRAVFTKALSSDQTYEFDYIYLPADLVLGDSPKFPSQFHDIIYHGMLIEDEVIQKVDKARANIAYNSAKFESYLADIAYWNSQIYQWS